MNLNVVTQALNGGLAIADPARDREYKRVRRQISDGIQGVAIGTAVLVAAVLTYIFIPNNAYTYVICLVLALFGIVKLFRSIGAIVDARVGPKLLDPELQPRTSTTGNLTAPTSINSGSIPQRPSQRLSMDQTRTSSPPAQNTRPVSMSGPLPMPQRTGNLPAEPPLRQGTGRINREQSTALRRPEQEDDLMSRLRN
jgi:hypothetical protein